MQTDAGHGVDQAEERPREPSAEEADPAAARIVGGESADEGADRHHSLDADIYDAGSLREAGAESREEERRRGDEHRIDQKSEIGEQHTYFPPSPLTALRSTVRTDGVIAMKRMIVPMMIFTTSVGTFTTVSLFPPYFMAP